jgi:hypothetical protein
MKCSNCGMDNIVSDAVHCPNCGASLITPGNWNDQPSAPQQQYQQPPQPAQPQYQPPQQYQPPKPVKSKNVPTVRNVGMTEVLFLISGFLLLIAGFGNTSALTSSFHYGGQYPILGIVALLAGLFIVGAVIMPGLVKNMDNMEGLIILCISVLFFFWGLAALYGNNIGWYGAELIAASLAGLAGSALKLGFVK